MCRATEDFRLRAEALKPFHLEVFKESMFFMGIQWDPNLILVCRSPLKEGSLSPPPASI